MKRPVLNFVINAMMAICMSAIIGIGFLIEFTLISGQNRWLKYGENVELYFLGMNRHQWGSLHLYLGFLLIGLLVLHIFLHWHMVMAVYKKLIKRPILNILVGLGFVLISLLLILIPLFIKPEIKLIERGNGRHALYMVQPLDSKG